jgi:hypothetical protein
MGGEMKTVRLPGLNRFSFYPREIRFNSIQSTENFSSDTGGLPFQGAADLPHQLYGHLSTLSKLGDAKFDDVKAM